jgi:hypothetical protein
MHYFIVPVNSGVLDIDYEYLQEGIQTSDTQAYVVLREGFEIRATWQEITEDQFDGARPVIIPNPPDPTLADKVDALGVMMVQLMLGGS